MEYLVGPLAENHAPALQMVGGVLGHLKIARALCALDEWLRTLHASAATLRHLPSNGVRSGDVTAIFNRLMRIAHSPSFLKVHTFSLPTIDIILLPSCLDFGPVLFGGLHPRQYPTLIQFGFVIRQMVHQLREQMQASGIYVDHQIEGHIEVPWALERALASLLILLELAFRHNRLQMHCLLKTPLIKEWCEYLLQMEVMSTLSSTIFQTSADWRPYAQHRLLEAAALLRFAKTWPIQGASRAQHIKHVAQLSGRVALPRHAYLIADKLSWHEALCPIALLHLRNLDTMLAADLTEQMCLYDTAHWHDHRQVAAAVTAFAHLQEHAERIMHTQGRGSPFDCTALKELVEAAPAHLDDWPHHPMQTAHGNYSRARSALLSVLAQPPAFGDCIGVRRGHDVLAYVAATARGIANVCVEIHRYVQVELSGIPTASVIQSQLTTGVLLPPMSWSCHGSECLVIHQRTGCLDQGTARSKLTAPTYHPSPLAEILLMLTFPFLEALATTQVPCCGVDYKHTMRPCIGMDYHFQGVLELANFAQYYTVEQASSCSTSRWSLGVASPSAAHMASFSAQFTTCSPPTELCRTMVHDTLAGQMRLDSYRWNGSSSSTRQMG